MSTSIFRSVLLMVLPSQCPLANPVGAAMIYVNPDSGQGRSEALTDPVLYV